MNPTEVSAPSAPSPWRAIASAVWPVRCDECHLPWPHAGDARWHALLTALTGVLFVAVLAAALALLSYDTFGPHVLAEVVDSRIGIEPGTRIERGVRTDRYFAEVVVRYVHAGRTLTARIRQPRARRRLGDAQAMLARARLGDRVPIRVPAHAPGYPTLIEPRHGWILAAYVLLVIVLAGAASLAGALQQRRLHVARHTSPRRSRANFDHDDALVRPRLFGPKLPPQAPAVAVAGALGVFALSELTLPWLALPAAGLAVAFVSLGRLGRAAVALQRLRRASAQLEPPAGFAPGATYSLRLAGLDVLPGALATQVELREEAPDPHGVWQGAATATVPTRVEAALSGRRVVFTLPEDAPPPHWRSDARRRWTLRLGVDRAEATFDLDFAPLRPPPPRRAPAFPDASQWLAECRSRLGEAPRRLDRRTLARLRVRPPEWMDTNHDRLAAVFRDQEALLQRGRVVWGYVVQANTLLFEPGPGDCPAALVYGADPSFAARLGDLAAAAGRLFATKDAPIDRLSQSVADELDRLLRYRLPEWLLTDEAYFAAVMVFRAHLPGRVLQRRFLPVLVAPELTPVAMVLPAQFWSDGLLAAWSEQGASA